MAATIQVHPCACGGVPQIHVSRAGEDCMEAWLVCTNCGTSSDPIEHVMGGQEAREWAAAEWNRMRQEQARAARVAGKVG
jgi:hypothetical protein